MQDRPPDEKFFKPVPENGESYLNDDFIKTDPRIEKKEKKAQLQQEQRQQLTFKQAAAKYLIKKQAEYKTAKQVKKVSSQFRDYVYPYIGDMQVKDIERPHLISMLENYYLTVPSTAIRVINHVEKVIQQAIIEGKRKTANPAVWHKNLSLVFPSKEKIAPTQHHPSLPWKEAIRRASFIDEVLDDGACLSEARTELLHLEQTLPRLVGPTLCQ